MKFEEFIETKYDKEGNILSRKRADSPEINSKKIIFMSLANIMKMMIIINMMKIMIIIIILIIKQVVKLKLLKLLLALFMRLLHPKNMYIQPQQNIIRMLQ